MPMIPSFLLRPFPPGKDGERKHPVRRVFPLRPEANSSPQYYIQEKLLKTLLRFLDTRIGHSDKSGQGYFDVLSLQPDGIERSLNVIGQPSCKSFRRGEAIANVTSVEQIARMRRIIPLCDDTLGCWRLDRWNRVSAPLQPELLPLRRNEVCQKIEGLVTQLCLSIDHHVRQRNRSWPDLAAGSGERNAVILYPTSLEFREVPATNCDKACLSTEQREIRSLTLRQTTGIDHRFLLHLIGQPGERVDRLGIFIRDQIAVPILIVDFATIGRAPGPVIY